MDTLLSDLIHPQQQHPFTALSCCPSNQEQTLVFAPFVATEKVKLRHRGNSASDYSVNSIVKDIIVSYSIRGSPLTNDNKTVKCRSLDKQWRWIEDILSVKSAFY